MKHHILHNFEASTPLKEKSPDHLNDLHKLKPLKNFDVSLTSFLGGVMNCVKPVGRNSSWPWSHLDIKSCQELQFTKIFKMIRGFFRKWCRNTKCDFSCQTLVPDLNALSFLTNKRSKVFQRWKGGLKIAISSVKMLLERNLGIESFPQLTGC